MDQPLTVDLVDGTYELFRHYFGRPSGSGGRQGVATRGVLATVVGLLESGATHIGVATDHVVESFRNALWPAYKTGEGIPEDLARQFPLLEEALAALGVAVFPMVDLEADDGLASLAAVAAGDSSVAQVRIWSPDKDLAQCVSGTRVVQVESRTGAVRDEAGVRERFGVPPSSIPDWLALVGDSADGFPGIAGWGKASAAAVLSVYGHLDQIPDDPDAWVPAARAAVRGAPRLAATLAAERDLASLFRELATLRREPPLVGEIGELGWLGPTPDWAAHPLAALDDRLTARVERLVATRTGSRALP